MNNFIYWPYDELSLDSSDNFRSITVTSPWLKATVPLSDSKRPSIALLVEKFQKQELNAEDMGLVNWFFKDFHQLPLCYILPAPKGQETLDQHGIKDKEFLHLSLEEFLLKSIAMDSCKPSDIKADEVAQIIARLSRNEWAWDMEAALEFAKFEDKIYPESLFSVGRRFHLLEVMESDRGRELFELIEKLPEDRYAQAVTLLVRQNHYVTQNCQRSLIPALEVAGQARPILESFILAETGHDRLLEASLKALDSKASDVLVLSQTRALMHLLRMSAQRNFLAFAMAVDFFERSSYQKTDPLAQLLRKGGFHKAAIPIHQHKLINDAGEHENVACTFLQYMASCEAEFATEALRFAEAISLVMNSITAAIKELIAG